MRILNFITILTASIHFQTTITNAATLDYSTYFGGPGYDGAFAVVVDSVGNAYVAGGTSSTNTFPTLKALQPDYGGGSTEGVIAGFDPNGGLLFSTYFGGVGYDYINAIALDRDGNIIIAGETHSPDLPTTDDAFQPNYNGGSAFGYGDGFVAKITSDGSQLLYCSYFGGSGDEKVNSLAIDQNGAICVTGQTDSRNLPLKNPLQVNFGGGESDGYIAKFDSTLTNLLFSTYLGGENRDEDQHIAVDQAGLVYISGVTLSTNFPITPGAFQTNHVVASDVGENWDGFVAKFKSDGSGIIYSTYFGEALNDAAYGIAVNSQGSAYITGQIRASFDNIVLGFQPIPGLPGGDAYVAKLKPDGSNLEWFSFLGGSDEDHGYGIFLDKDANIFLTGVTESRNFPVIDAPQPKFGGGLQDAFVAKVSADGKKLLYSTYLGGANEEWGYALTVDSAGNVIAAGQSASLNFPLRNAIQTTNASALRISSPVDEYVVKLSPAIEQPPLKTGRSGNNILFSWSTNFTGFRLEANTSLSGPDAWQIVRETPLVIGNQFTLVRPFDHLHHFFRLKRP